MAKFAQNFWGTEFCSMNGFDTLLKRLKEGKRMATDVEEFLEKRVKIEREYAESLTRLAKTASGKDEIGTLRMSWDQVKLETEIVGRHHSSLANRLHDEAHALKDFYLQQKDQRKKSEDTVKKAAAHKKTSYEKNNRLKTTYDSKCKEADKNEENYSRMQTNPLAKPKDLQAAQRKMEVSRTAANNSDIAYQDAVKNLEEARQLWEREMEFLCRQFQELEEKRIAYLRHVLWSYCNYCSQETVDDDDSYENIRKSLESCNVDNDIELFVCDRATGTERPAAIPYFNYYHPSNPTGDTLGLRTPVSVSMRQPPQKDLPPLPFNANVSTSSNKPADEGVYSAVDEDLKVGGEDYYSIPKNAPATGAPDKVVVSYDYQAQGDEELSLKEGEILEVIDKEDELWWCGVTSGGRTGMFPSTYVEPFEEGADDVV